MQLCSNTVINVGVECSSTLKGDLESIQILPAELLGVDSETIDPRLTVIYKFRGAAPQTTEFENIKAVMKYFGLYLPDTD